MADPMLFPTDPAAERAERARRNGRHSRGPVSELGKARASRNALRHGLTARVHLLLDRDDDADFATLAGSIESELAPQGALEGFLVARLTAAMWHTGRAERMEARAFGEGPDPDPDRLRLAMRYQGSTGRELFRCLRSLHELRRRPLAGPGVPVSTAADGFPRADAPAATPSATSAELPSIDHSRLRVAAWGGERGGPVPPGFMPLRPVPGVGPLAWVYTQDRAFPGDVPLLVYADGTVRSPEGELLEDVWSPRRRPELGSGPPEPISTSRGPASAPLAPGAPPSAADDESSEPFGGLRHGMTLKMLNGSASSPPAMCIPQRRNEPSQPIEKPRDLIDSEGSATVPPSAVPGTWERLWGWAPPERGHEATPSDEAMPELTAAALETPIEPQISLEVRPTEAMAAPIDDRSKVPLATKTKLGRRRARGRVLAKSRWRASNFESTDLQGTAANGADRSRSELTTFDMS